MKKILFVLPYYKLGGTLTSFVNLVSVIDKDKYSVDVFALTNDVDDFSLLPKGVKYLGLNLANINNRSYKSRFKILLICFLKTCKRLLANLGLDFSDIIFKNMAKPLSGNYDVVIAYQEGQSTRMTQYISAPVKIAWIHSIYSRFKSLSKVSAVDVYNCFDKIVCVSYTAAKDMIECEPKWRDKIYVVYNAVDPSIILNKIGDGVVFNKKINILSIGRIDSVKRFSFIPGIAHKLKEFGYKFDWWIIGSIADVKEYDKLSNNIVKYNVEDSVHYLGSQSNPYPFIKSSTLLVCLSSSETFNYTIAEAKTIGIPVVSTDFSCVYEFIDDKKTGIIMPIEQVFDGIISLLNDNNLYSEIQKRLNQNNNQSYITKNQYEV